MAAALVRALGHYVVNTSRLTVSCGLSLAVVLESSDKKDLLWYPLEIYLAL